MSQPAVPSALPGAGRAEIVVDLDAITANVAALRRRAEGAALMTVVKADGYGHGLVPAARAARAGGATWLGAATLEEALALRQAGDDGPVLTWLTVPGEDVGPAVAAHVDVTAYTPQEVSAVAAAARACGVRARLQLKVDTGLSRGGATMADWPALVAAAAERERAGELRVTGVWSHFACSDQPEHPANAEQEKVYADALAVAEGAGLRPEVRHLCNSAGALTRPSAHYDLVRVGLACYGLSPLPQLHTAADLGLRPAMRVQGRLALVKPIPGGAGVSYGHTYHAARDTRVGLVPMGYGDGVPWRASNAAPVLAAGRVRTIAGRVCMDQFVLDLGDDQADTGDPVVLFGAGADGEPTAQDWAEACGTISYEIVTGVGGRMARRYLPSGAETADA